MKKRFVLTRVARAYGGDRYECEKKGDPEYLVIYIPQDMSRIGEKVVEAFEVTFTAIEK